MIIDKSNAHLFIKGSSMDCSYMNITEIRFVPNNVTELNATGNFLNELVIPCGMEKLSVSNNNIKHLKLTENLEFLSCSHNKLKELNFNDKLKHVYAHFNELTKLTNIPKSLLYMNISNNNIKELPLLPDSLKFIYCHHTLMGNVPECGQKLSNWIKNHNKKTHRKKVIEKIKIQNNYIG